MYNYRNYINEANKLFILPVLFIWAIYSCQNITENSEEYSKQADLYFEKSNYDSSLFYYYKYMKYYNKQNIDTENRECLKKIAEIYFIQNDLDKARQFITQSLDEGIYEKDSLTILLLNELLAKYFFLSGNEKEALAMYSGILKRKKALYGINHHLVADTYNNIGIVQKTTGEYGQAINSLMKSIHILSDIYGTEHQELVKTKLNLADIYTLKGDYLKSHELLQEVFQNIDNVDQKTQAGYYNILGNLYLKMGKLDLAFANYQSSLSFAKNHFRRDYKRIAGIHNNIANVYNNKSDYQNAIFHYELALENYVKSGIKDNVETAKTYYNLGNVHLKKDEYAIALDYYGKAMRINSKLSYPSSLLASNIYKSMGYGYLLMNNSSKAIKSIDKSLTLLKNILGENNPQIAENYLIISKLFMQQGYFKNSLFYCNMCLKIYENDFENSKSKYIEAFLNKANIYKYFGYNNLAEDTYNEVKILINKYLSASHLISINLLNDIADFYTQKKEHIKALEFYKKALFNNSFQALLPDSNVDFINLETKDILNSILYEDQYLISLHGIANSLINKKNSLVTDQLMALKLFHNCDALIKSLRAELLSNRDKMRFNSYTSRIYADAVGLCYNLQKTISDSTKFVFINEALLFSEWNRANSLNTNYSYNENTNKTAKEIEQLLHLDSLNNIIRNYQTELNKINNSKIQSERNESVHKLEDSIFSLSREKEILIKELKTAGNSLFNPQKNIDFNVKNVHKFLSNNEIIIEFINYDSLLYAICIAKDTLVINRVIVKSDFFNFNLNLYNLVNNFNVSDLIKLNKILSGILIKPISGIISKYEKVIFIPHNQLFFIPFSMLYYDKHEEMQSPVYLVDKKEIVYSYSVAFWVNNKLREAKQNKEFAYDIIAFAPGFTDQKSYFRVDKQMFSSLPYTIKEVNQISRLFIDKNKLSKSYVNNDATKENFIAAMEKSSIIHIATHGYVNSSFPQLSYLIFQKETPSFFKRILKKEQHFNIFSEDEIIRISEFNRYKSNADLVVLSACQTGLGEYIPNEGLISFSREFMLSGAINVINTLWSVDDKITKEFMIDFYQNMLKGESYSRALQNTKIKMINNPETSHPRNWAGYILFGN